MSEKSQFRQKSKGIFGFGLSAMGLLGILILIVLVIIGVGAAIDFFRLVTTFDILYSVNDVGKGVVSLMQGTESGETVMALIAKMGVGIDVKDRLKKAADPFGEEFPNGYSIRIGDDKIGGTERGEVKSSVVEVPLPGGIFGGKKSRVLVNVW